MPASDQHREYVKYKPRWEMVRDCVGGADDIKDKRTQYLPMPNQEDRSEENVARYKQYLQRANFINFTGSTLEGLLGMVFRRDAQIELFPTIEYLNDNATGSGISLNQLIRSRLANTLQCGRDGLLVDYPPAPEGLTVAEIAALDLKARIMPYKAETIVNWRTETIAGRQVLTMVVLAEDHEVISDDGFTSDIKKYHRVLRLDDGVYSQALYNHNDEMIDYAEPRMADGSTWDFIPFQFIGAADNDAKIDKAPLYDIAELNVAHYRNSADFEEASFIVGQPTPVFAGLSQSWVDDVMKGGVMLGSRTGIMLPDGGSASLLQPSENSMPERGMAMKEAQMIKLGARVIEDTKGSETAEAARIRYAGQTSKLAVVVANVEDAIIKCLNWCRMFMGGEGESFVSINREYYDKRVDPQVIMAEIALLDRGIIAKTDLRQNLRSSGRLDADRLDEDIDTEAEIIDLP